MTNLERFRELFRSGFGAPTLHTDKFRDVYADMVPASDALDGPLFSIFESGNCDYVFRGEETRFPDVDDAEGFRRWCLELVEDYRNIVLEYEPQGELEQADHAFLLKQGEIMEQLTQLAYSIIKEQGH